MSQLHTNIAEISSTKYHQISPKCYPNITLKSHKYIPYITITKISPKYLQNVNLISSKYHPSINQISQKYCPDITRNIALISPNYFPNSTQISPRHHPLNTNTRGRLLASFLAKIVIN